eukprot:PLAT15474.1.p1 GENE.PLAT15474.1~~PLAT15474.1.p1  ORF type:complete len:407 (+),score=181.87 PLAT15474.1:16-1236(+)
MAAPDAMQPEFRTALLFEQWDDVLRMVKEDASLASGRDEAGNYPLHLVARAPAPWTVIEGVYLAKKAVARSLNYKGHSPLYEDDSGRLRRCVLQHAFVEDEETRSLAVSAAAAAAAAAAASALAGGGGRAVTAAKLGDDVGRAGSEAGSGVEGKAAELEAAGGSSGAAEGDGEEGAPAVPPQYVRQMNGVFRGAVDNIRQLLQPSKDAVDACVAAAASAVEARRAIGSALAAIKRAQLKAQAESSGGLLDVLWAVIDCDGDGTLSVAETVSAVELWLLVAQPWLPQMVEATVEVEMQRRLYVEKSIASSFPDALEEGVDVDELEDDMRAEMEDGRAFLASTVDSSVRKAIDSRVPFAEGLHRKLCGARDVVDKHAFKRNFLSSIMHLTDPELLLAKEMDGADSDSD